MAIGSDKLNDDLPSKGTGMALNDRLTLLGAALAIGMPLGIGTCSVSNRLDGMDGWIRTHLETHQDGGVSASDATLNIVLDRGSTEGIYRDDPRGFALENFDAIGRWRSEAWRLFPPPPPVLFNNLENLQSEAAEGNVRAVSALGMLYADGLGVPQDEQEASRLFSEAADAGDAGAQNNLGVMYANGRGVSQDDAVAFEWFEGAAAQGNVFAQNNLGIMYANGRGVEQDYVSAHKWLNLAGAGGYGRARELRDILAEEMSAEDLQAAVAAARAELRGVTIEGRGPSGMRE